MAHRFGGVGGGGGGGGAKALQCDPVHRLKDAIPTRKGKISAAIVRTKTTAQYGGRQRLLARHRHAERGLGKQIHPPWSIRSPSCARPCAPEDFRPARRAPKSKRAGGGVAKEFNTHRGRRRIAMGTMTHVYRPAVSANHSRQSRVQGECACAEPCGRISNCRQDKRPDADGGAADQHNDGLV